MRDPPRLAGKLQAVQRAVNAVINRSAHVNTVLPVSYIPLATLPSEPPPPYASEPEPALESDLAPLGGTTPGPAGPEPEPEPSANAQSAPTTLAMASEDTGEMETLVTTQNASYEPKVTIDASAYPHIIDETLDYILMDHASARPLILVCRAWKRTICSAVYAHIRAEPSWGPSELGEQDVKTLAGWFQISTVPPPGRQRLSFPELQWSGAVSLPKALVSAAPYIQAFDVHGPMAADYLQTL